ncbi:MAG: hypothetical protein ACLTG2_08935 [Clostridia bacterium]
MAEQSCRMYGYTQALNSTKSLQNITRLTTRVYSISIPEMKLARHNKILTGLDTYGRGRSSVTTESCSLRY